MWRALGILVFGSVLVGCHRNVVAFEGLDVHYPKMQFPTDHPYNDTTVALGERLFHEKLLSRDSSVSCSSCHQLEYALADGVPISPGVAGRLGFRNSPSLWNVGFKPHFMREGGVPTLEMQVLVPLQDHNEMDFNVVDAARRLNRVPSFRMSFLEAYGDTASPYLLVRALASYERSLQDFNAPFDQYLSGSAQALSREAVRGGQLFYGKAGCVQCHSGVLFSSFDFAFNGMPIQNTEDTGRERLTGLPTDSFAFVIPSLRFCSTTAPYMHDGSISTLREVVELYNAGGTGHPLQDSRIVPLGLSDSELNELVAFLEHL